MISPSPALYAKPETVDAVSRTHAIAILIGSYDGSGNYGDIAQLDAALGMLDRFEPGLLVLPILERSFVESSKRLQTAFVNRPAQALFFDPDAAHDDALQPVAAPADLTFAACYLYGGGYLNGSWGERKLAMLRAAEALLAESGAPAVCRICSGLQIEAEWIAGLDEGDAAALRSFGPIGVRDSPSAAAAAALGSAVPTRDTGDDAVGLLRGLQLPADDVAPDDAVYVNVHFAEHEWVSPQPDTALNFCADLVAELERRLGQPVVTQPLIAYLDDRIDERPAMARLAEAWERRGLSVLDPQVLRPSALRDGLPDLLRARLTLSLSYHVALTSLLLGIPAALLRDNAYYEQKGVALAEGFDLPPAFALSSGADPAAEAGALAAAVFDPSAGPALRRRIAARAANAMDRRAAVEADLLARLGGAATNAMADRIDKLGERLRERSLEPAALLAEVSVLRAELGLEPGAETPVPSPPAENAAAEEMLAAVIGSRSWRMTAPLRRLGSVLRRH